MAEQVVETIDVAADGSQASREPEQPQAVSIQSLFSDSAIYGLAKVVDPAIGFALLPLVTALLLPSDYGVISLFNITLHIAFVVGSIGVHQAFLRFYTEAESTHDRTSIVNAALWVSCAAWVVMLAAMTPFASSISQGLFGTSDPSLTYVLLAASFVQVIHAVACNLLQADGRAWTYLGNVVLATIAVRGLGVAAILLGAGATGWIVCEAIGRLLTTAVLVVTALPWARPRPSKQLLQKVGWYGAMIVPAMLSFYVMSVSDKYLIRALTNEPFVQVGLYSVGERIAGIMHLVNLAFVLGWQRFAFRNMHRDDGAGTIAYGLFLYTAGVSYLGLALVMLGDDLTRVMVNERYAEGIIVITPLTLAALMAGLASLAEIGLHKVQRPQRISTLSMIAAGANIVLNVYAIPRYGIAGAAWITFWCQTARLVLVWTCSQRAYYLPLDYRRLGIAAAVYFAIWLAGWLAEPLGWRIAAVVQLLLVLTTPFVLWRTPFVTREERIKLSIGMLRGRRALTSRFTGS